MRRNPLDSELDAMGDQVFVTCDAAASQGDGNEAPSCDASTIASAKRACTAAGIPCDVAVSRNAAMCIATTDRDLSTLEGPYMELVYHAGYQRPVWNVVTVRRHIVGGGRGGDVYTVDASDGAFLGVYYWEERP